ncbi:hypothetical protein, partial [Escherichia coli]|uniref:hypothetical protein n=1 Tax=Escherichia coli TaxID=562 RepID=UPI003EE3F5BF
MAHGNRIERNGWLAIAALCARRKRSWLINITNHGTIFPWNEIGSNGSPFVLTFAKIGITAAAGIINFVVLTAALSG